MNLLNELVQRELLTFMIEDTRRRVWSWGSGATGGPPPRHRGERRHCRALAGNIAVSPVMNVTYLSWLHPVNTMLPDIPLLSCDDLRTALQAKSMTITGPRVRSFSIRVLIGSLSQS